MAQRRRTNGSVLIDGSCILKGPFADVIAVQSLFGRKQIKVNYMFCNVKDVRKRSVMYEIKVLFDSGVDDSVLYYSGFARCNKSAQTYHKGHSDWFFERVAFEDDQKVMRACISYEDIIKEWGKRRKSRAHQRLFIIADCCFSGTWVLKSRAHRNVFVQAACKWNESAYDTVKGGTFTRLWINSNEQSAPILFIANIATKISNIFSKTNTPLNSFSSDRHSYAVGKGLLFING